MKCRYPKLIRDQNGRPLCRGCGKPVPKGRQTWCSNQCYAARCPGMVISAVFSRDKGVCAICGRDTIKLQRACQRMLNRAYDLPWASPVLAGFGSKGERVRKAVHKAGFPGTYRQWWEADHIIPFSEGGETILENMRTLCVPCHRKRTRHWNKQKANKQISRKVLL